MTDVEVWKGQCDDCHKFTEVGRWQESFYHLCLNCAAKATYHSAQFAMVIKDGGKDADS